MNTLEDTIVAIATPPGKGGVGIVRLSGSQSLQVARQIFHVGQGKKELPQKIQPNYLSFGWVSDRDGKPIDNGYFVYFQAPASYTRQEVVEFQLHGSPKALEQVLQTCLLFPDVRLAEPGEFTKRAFIAGKIDLSQAEAVADLIEAQTQTSARLAGRQLEGDISRQIVELREILLLLLAEIQGNVNFPEEDIPEVKKQKIHEQASQTIGRVRTLLKDSQHAWMYREGLQVALIGLPNMGKSSLFNALLRRDRAIVSNISGTTRDTIDEAIDIEGVPVVLTDTAGITASEDHLEQIGIQRSEQAIERADLLLLVVDAAEPGKTEERFRSEVSEQVLSLLEQKPVVRVANKIDLVENTSKSGSSKLRHHLVSAATGKGLAELRQAMVGHFFSSEVAAETTVTTNTRHWNLLQRAEQALAEALQALEQDFDVDTISIDVERAVSLLGEILGLEMEESLLDEIFSRFCIGK